MTNDQIVECRYVRIVQDDDAAESKSTPADPRVAQQKQEALHNLMSVLLNVAAIAFMWHISSRVCAVKYQSSDIPPKTVALMRTVCYAMSCTCVVWCRGICQISFSLGWHYAMVLWLSGIRINQEPVYFAFLFIVHAVVLCVSCYGSDEDDDEEQNDEESDEVGTTSVYIAVI